MSRVKSLSATNIIRSHQSQPDGNLVKHVEALEARTLLLSNPTIQVLEANALSKSCKRKVSQISIIWTADMMRGRNFHL